MSKCIANNSWCQGKIELVLYNSPKWITNLKGKIVCICEYHRRDFTRSADTTLIARLIETVRI